MSWRELKYTSQFYLEEARVGKFLMKSVLKTTQQWENAGSFTGK